MAPAPTQGIAWHVEVGVENFEAAAELEKFLAVVQKWHAREMNELTPGSQDHLDG